MRKVSAQVKIKSFVASSSLKTSDPDHWLFFYQFFSIIDHFKKSKNSNDRLIKIEKSIDRSIGLKKSINRAQNIYQAQEIKQLKKNRTSFFYLLFIVTGHSLILNCYSDTVTSKTSNGEINAECFALSDQSDSVTQ